MKPQPAAVAPAGIPMLFAVGLAAAAAAKDGTETAREEGPDAELHVKQGERPRTE